MTERAPTAAAARDAQARWRFDPLLRLWEQVERRELERLRGALAGARRAGDELAALRGRLAVAADRHVPRDVASGGEIARAVRYLARARQEVADAMERARTADAAAVEARGRHARARGAREALERRRALWLDAARRARDARSERELDDVRGLARRCRV